MLLLRLKIRPFSKWGRKAKSLGTTLGGGVGGGDNPGAADQAQSSVGRWGLGGGGMEKTCGKVNSAEDMHLPLPSPSLIHPPSF